MGLVSLLRHLLPKKAELEYVTACFFFVYNTVARRTPEPVAHHLPFLPSPLPVARSTADARQRVRRSSSLPPMGRKTSKRSPDPEATVAWVPWKFTKCMNARDLSRDDDYLSHLFIEKISGVCAAPLLVHRMNPERLLPKTNTQAVFNIIQRVCPGPA